MVNAKFAKDWINIQIIQQIKEIYVDCRAYESCPILLAFSCSM